MKTSNAGISLIERWELFLSEPYQDAIGVWTIGFGHTRDVTENTLPITIEQARELLKQDVWYVEGFINNNLNLKQCQFDALVSLLFNIGTGIKSTHLYHYLETDPDSRRVADEWIEFRKAGGKYLRGLLRRRLDELLLYYSW